MANKTEWNRVAYQAWHAAQGAADELMVTLPDCPPKPVWPQRPFTPRAVAWFSALVAAAADHADDQRITNARDRLRLAVEQMLALGKPPYTADVRDAFTWFRATVGDAPENAESDEEHLAALVAEGRLTPSQAHGWRVILGLPEPDAARAQQRAG